MSNSISNEIAKNVEDTLDIVARSLREASERTQDLSEEASEVLSNVARQATHEVQQHPVVSLAAALTAVAALVGLIAATRSSKDAPK
jgi:ElaB/YqjD/DUF883 family membrane-anchored ribosome-binding protein